MRSRGILPAAGEMRAQLEARDWAATPLGRTEGWPQSLRTVLGLVLDSAIPMALLWGPDARLFYNDPYVPVLGARHPHALGQPVLDTFADVRHQWQPMMDRVAAGEAVVVPDQLYPLIRGDIQDHAWFAVSYSPVRDESGEVAGVLVAMVETTQRVLAARRRAQVETELREREAKFRAMTEQADVGIAIADPDGRIVYVNARHCELLGRSFDELVGSTIHHLTQRDGDADDSGRFHRLLAHGEPFSTEKYVPHPGGDARWIGVSVSPRRDIHGRIVGGIAVTVDLTARHRAEENLRRAHAELERRVEERTRELARANERLQQELRERQAAEDQIKALLKQLLTVQEDERRRIAREIHDTLGQQMTALRMTLEAWRLHGAARADLSQDAQRALEISQEIDASIDFLMSDLRPAALDHLGLGAAFADLVRSWSERTGIAAEYHPSGLDGLALPPLIEINLYRLAQEALHNVHKHARATSVAVLLDRRGDELVLIVEDNGVGFDPEAAASAERRPGVGLIGMRERAMLIGGEFEVESAPGRGTIVFVRVRPSN